MTDIETELKVVTEHIRLLYELLETVQPGTELWTDLNEQLLVAIDTQADLNENAVNQ